MVQLVPVVSRQIIVYKTLLLNQTNHAFNDCGMNTCGAANQYTNRQGDQLHAHCHQVVICFQFFFHWSFSSKVSYPWYVDENPSNLNRRRM